MSFQLWKFNARSSSEHGPNHGRRVQTTEFQSRGYKNMKSRNVPWRLSWACLLVSLSLTNAFAQQPASSNTDLQARGPVPASSTSSNGSHSGGVADAQPRKGNPTELGPTVRIGPGDEL